MPRWLLRRAGGIILCRHRHTAVSMPRKKDDTDRLVPLLLRLQQQPSPTWWAFTADSAAARLRWHMRKLHADALPILHDVLAQQQVAAVARLHALDLILEITEQSERQAGLGDVAVVDNPHRLPDKYDRLTISLRDHPTLIQRLQARVSADETDRSVRFAVAKLFAWQGLARVPALLSFASSEQTAENAAVGWLWRAIPEIDRRQLTQQQQDLPTLLRPLAASAADIMVLPHDKALSGCANVAPPSAAGQRPCSLGALVGSRLRWSSSDSGKVDSATIAEQALQWAMGIAGQPGIFTHLAACRGNCCRHGSGNNASTRLAGLSEHEWDSLECFKGPRSLRRHRNLFAIHENTDSRLVIETIRALARMAVRRMPAELKQQAAMLLLRCGRSRQNDK